MRPLIPVIAAAFLACTPTPAPGCEPACAGRACGDDGCGASCGACASGATCSAGVCVAACTPDCAGRQCGDDGCGGSCGTCTSPARCSAGVCCVAACGGRVCGDDGCGGSCGSCAPPASCSAGACVPPCAPACAGKACGDDGCGGSCGTCASGRTCTAAGACQPATPTPGCPLGGTCAYLDRVAWRYLCTAADACTRSTAIGEYGSYEACQTWGCMGGNSRCGDQFGNPSEPDRWSCEACRASCQEGALAACGAARETAQGCLLTDSTWGDYLAECICQ